MRRRWRRSAVKSMIHPDEQSESEGEARCLVRCLRMFIWSFQITKSCCTWAKAKGALSFSNRCIRGRADCMWSSVDLTSVPRNSMVSCMICTDFVSSLANWKSDVYSSCRMISNSSLFAKDDSDWSIDWKKPSKSKFFFSSLKPRLEYGRFACSGGNGRISNWFWSFECVSERCFFDDKHEKNFHQEKSLNWVIFSLISRACCWVAFKSAMHSSISLCCSSRYSIDWRHITFVWLSFSRHCRHRSRSSSVNIIDERKTRFHSSILRAQRKEVG